MTCPSCSTPMENRGPTGRYTRFKCPSCGQENLELREATEPVEWEPLWLVWWRKEREAEKKRKEER